MAKNQNIDRNVDKIGAPKTWLSFIHAALTNNQQLNGSFLSTLFVDLKKIIASCWNIFFIRNLDEVWKI